MGAWMPARRLRTHANVSLVLATVALVAAWVPSFRVTGAVATGVLAVVLAAHCLGSTADGRDVGVSHTRARVALWTAGIALCFAVVGACGAMVYHGPDRPANDGLRDDRMTTVAGQNPRAGGERLSDAPGD